MSGAVYFAELSNRWGTVVSDSAVLTVVTASEDAGEVFSVQLGSSDVGGWEPLGAAEMTGAFPMTNWNAVSVVASGAEQVFPVNDEFGVGGGVDLIVRGAADADSFENPLSSSTAISKLMNSFISTWWRQESGINEIGEGRIELVFTNLDNAVSYNAYVYLADPIRNDPAAGGREADIHAGTGVTNFTGQLPTSRPTTFTASTNQNPLGTRDPGNYVRLTGITPVSGAITITVDYYDPIWEGWGAGIAGVQLVKESRDEFGPVFNPQPVDQGVITNTSAILTTDVFGSPAPITMQWYEIAGSSTNLIPGATGTSYTTPPVTDATSGQGYFIIASTGLNTTTSQVAYVTGLHLGYPALGWLQVDQYFVTNSAVLMFWIRPGGPSIHPPEHTGSIPLKTSVRCPTTPRSESMASSRRG